MSQEAKKQNDGAVDKLKSLGLKVFTISNADRQAFVDAVQGVYAANAERLGGADFIKQAQETP